MSGANCKFLSSPYFVPEFNNWHLLPDALDEIVNEFYSYMIADSYDDAEREKWENRFEEHKQLRAKR